MAGSAGNAEYGNYHFRNGKLRMRFVVKIVIIAMTALTSVAHGQSRIALRRKRVYTQTIRRQGCWLRTAAWSARGIVTINEASLVRCRATKR
jgi:hypothetical protein